MKQFDKVIIANDRNNTLTTRQITLHLFAWKFHSKHSSYCQFWTMRLTIGRSRIDWHHAWTWPSSCTYVHTCHRSSPRTVSNRLAISRRDDSLLSPISLRGGSRWAPAESWNSTRDTVDRDCVASAQGSWLARTREAYKSVVHACTCVRAYTSRTHSRAGQCLSGCPPRVST